MPGPSKAHEFTAECAEDAEKRGRSISQSSATDKQTGLGSLCHRTVQEGGICNETQCLKGRGR
jgi:hypothetical protein